MDLDIIPHYDAKLDCIQNTLFSILKNYVSTPEYLLFGTYDFQFDEQKISDGCIADGLSSGKADTMVNCEQFFRVSFDLLSEESDRQLQKIFDCLQHKEFILMEIATDQLPWRLNQDVYMEEHYCLLKGMDEKKKVLSVLDTYAIDTSSCIIPFDGMSIIKKLWRMDTTYLKESAFSPKEMIHMLLDRMQERAVLEHEKKFLDYIKNQIIDMSKEIQGYEVNLGFCPFMWNLYNIGRGRYQTAMLIQKLIQKEYSLKLEQIYLDLIDLSDTWEKVWNIFVKYTIKPGEKVYRRIILHVEKIMEHENEVVRKLEAYEDES